MAPKASSTKKQKKLRVPRWASVPCRSYPEEGKVWPQKLLLPYKYYNYCPKTHYSCCDVWNDTRYDSVLLDFDGVMVTGLHEHIIELDDLR